MEKPREMRMAGELVEKNARTLSAGRAATVTSIVSTREKVKEADNAKAGRVRVLLTSKLSNK